MILMVLLSFYSTSNSNDSYTSNSNDSYYDKREVSNNFNGSSSNVNASFHEDFYYDDGDSCGCDVICHIMQNFDYIGYADGHWGSNIFYDCDFYENPNYPNETCSDYVEYYDYEHYDYDYEDYKDYDYDDYDHDNNTITVSDD